MKRVICIKTEVFADTGGISIRKGSIYHVIDEIDEAQAYAEFFHKLADIGAKPAKGKWYELLEMPKTRHHECNFLEIPEDDYQPTSKHHVSKIDRTKLCEQR